MRAIGRSSMPSAFCWARPNPWKLSEHTVMAAMPCFVISTLSWTLHDVQEPQSPEPVMTRSQVSASSRSIPAGAGIDALRLRIFTTRATP